MALGHSYTDAAIQSCGRPEFGGMCALREIHAPELTGTKGIQFNFMVKRTQRSHEGEQVRFDLVSIFLDAQGNENKSASDVTLIHMADEPSDPSSFDFLEEISIDAMEENARQAVFKRYPGEELWEEEIGLLNVAAVVFN